MPGLSAILCGRLTAVIRLPKICAHISPAVTWAAPCNPDLGRAVLSYPHSPPSAQRNTRSELIHPTDVFSRAVGKRIFCRSALTANMHSSASSTKITDPYDRSGLRVQPSWRVTLAFISSLSCRGKTTSPLVQRRPEIADTHRAPSAPERPP